MKSFIAILRLRDYVKEGDEQVAIHPERRRISQRKHHNVQNWQKPDVQEKGGQKWESPVFDMNEPDSI